MSASSCFVIISMPLLDFIIMLGFMIRDIPPFTIKVIPVMLKAIPPRFSREGAVHTKTKLLMAVLVF